MHATLALGVQMTDPCRPRPLPSLYGRSGSDTDDKQDLYKRGFRKKGCLLCVCVRTGQHCI